MIWSKQHSLFWGIAAMLDDNEVVRLTRRLLEPYELPEDCPYLSEDQRELCKLTLEERIEWWGEWLMMGHSDQGQARSTHSP